MPKRTSSKYVLCVSNEGYLASLELHKVYRCLEDSEANRRGYVRIVDESGEDYVFPRALFVPIEVPLRARKSFSSAT